MFWLFICWDLIAFESLLFNTSYVGIKIECLYGWISISIILNMIVRYAIYKIIIFIKSWDLFLKYFLLNLLLKKLRIHFKLKFFKEIFFWFLVPPIYKKSFFSWNIGSSHYFLRLKSPLWFSYVCLRSKHYQLYIEKN